MRSRVIKYPSLYLNWLPRSFLKGLPPVQIIFTDDDYCFGGCYSPQYNWDYEERGYSTINKAAIFIPSNANETEKELASTIAHEMRHHYQTYKYGSNYNYLSWKNVSSRGTYKDNIVEFFNSCKREMDALQFQNKYAVCDHTAMWEEWIIKSNENNYK